MNSSPMGMQPPPNWPGMMPQGTPPVGFFPSMPFPGMAIPAPQPGQAQNIDLGLVPEAAEKPSRVVYPPNETIYVSNLKEKIKIDELKKALFHVFSQFGAIVEISAYKDLKRRGQAWIVFESLSSAEKAVGEMANFSFYGKPMQVRFAKVKSDVVSKKDGTFETRPLRKVQKAKKKKGSKSKKDKKDKKTVKTERGGPELVGVKDEPEAPDTPVPQALPPAHPNRVLFVENLPNKTTDVMLSTLFQQFQGYREARLVNGKPGIAFVEYEDVSQASTAKQALHNFPLGTNNMKVTYARQ